MYVSLHRRLVVLYALDLISALSMLASNAERTKEETYNC